MLLDQPPTAALDAATALLHRLDATDADGRITALGPDRLDSGVYRLVFATGDYFDATHRPAFYPQVQISFLVTGADPCHVPLVLSPFGYSTHRGS